PDTLLSFKPSNTRFGYNSLLCSLVFVLPGGVRYDISKQYGGVAMCHLLPVILSGSFKAEANTNEYDPHEWPPRWSDSDKGC
ncbi:hypothetical protein MO867_22260, partial [Microbulbifer sp. OS29]